MSIFDTLGNFLSGLGGPKDKGASNVYVEQNIDFNTLMTMYRGDWIARKLVDVPAKDSTKSWRNWKASAEVVEKIEKVEKSARVNMLARTCQGMQTARLLGASIMYFSVRGQSPSTPLNLEAVKEGDLQYTRVFNRFELGEEGFNDDMGSEWYGHPDFYTVNSRSGETVRIHPSRVVQYIGLPRIDMGARQTWWGDSVLQVAYDAIVNASAAQGHVASLIPEAKTDVMYIPGLGEMLSTTEGTDKITNRFMYAAKMKSMMNMVLLDGTGAETTDGESVGETWEQKQIRFADLPELLTQYLQVAAGAADIPMTRLLQQSAAGLNATGEGELRNYYDGLDGDRKTVLGPALSAFDEVLIRSATGTRDDSIWYEWAPLWSPTPEQKSKSFKEKGEGLKAIWETGLVPAPQLSDAAINMFVEDGDLPGLEGAVGSFARMSAEEQMKGKNIQPPKPEPTGGAAGGPGAPGATKVAAT